MGEVLTEAKIPFIAHHQRFAQDCPDEEWLIAAGSEGWIVVTRDKNIRRKANELKVFCEAKLIVFVLASSSASAADSAALLSSYTRHSLNSRIPASHPRCFLFRLAGRFHEFGSWRSPRLKCGQL